MGLEDFGDGECPAVHLQACVNQIHSRTSTEGFPFDRGKGHARALGKVKVSSKQGLYDTPVDLHQLLACIRSAQVGPLRRRLRRRGSLVFTSLVLLRLLFLLFALPLSESRGGGTWSG